MNNDTRKTSFPLGLGSRLGSLFGVPVKINLKNLSVSIALLLIVGAAVAQGPGGGRQGRNRGNSLSSLLHRADVQTELKVTDEQKSKIEALRPAGRPGGTPNGGAPNGGAPGNGGGQPGQAGPRGGAPDPAAMEARRAEEKKAIAEILTADQLARLEELLIQREGNQAILRKEVQEKLGLSDEQKGQIKTIQGKYNDANRELREKSQSGELDRSALREAMTTNRKVLVEELGKVLSAEQTSKLTALGGKPFTFDEGSI